MKHSINKTKKNNVFDNNANLASVDAIGCHDYPTYIKLKGTLFRLYLWGISRNCAAV